MKRTIRDNINVPYTLHDMSVCELKRLDKDIVMKTQTGIVELTYHEGDMVFVAEE